MTAEKDPRNHHYIPQAYLRGFGWKQGKRQWYTHALDLHGDRAFQPNVRNVCTQRDFMRVDLEGYEPFVLEKEMSKFESSAREATLRIAESKTFAGEDKNWVLNLMALFAVRYPQMREHMREIQEQMIRKMMDLSLATKERWESQVAAAEKAGKDVSRGVSYEDMKEFHERGGYKVEVSREGHIEAERKMHETMLDLMARRTWKLLWLSDEAGKFVTTDKPVVISWDNPNEVPAMFRRSPGFAMPDTEIIFPLTSKCLLMGRFDGEVGVHEVDTWVAGYLNTRMIGHAFNFAFSQDKAFPYVLSPDFIFFDDRFLERGKEFKEAQAKKRDAASDE